MNKDRLRRFIYSDDDELDIEAPADGDQAEIDPEVAEWLKKAKQTVDEEAGG